MMEKHLSNKRDIMIEIDKVQKEISSKSFNKNIQIGIFFFVICIMIFFLTFFINDLIQILKVYFRKRNNIKAKDKHYKKNDENDYDISGIQYENELDVIEDQIIKRNTNLENRMREMVDWKKSNKIPNVQIHNKIDMTVLESKFDNYTYDKKSNGDSFWKMILMPPKYYQLVNNKAKPFYRLRDDQ